MKTRTKVAAAAFTVAGLVGVGALNSGTASAACLAEDFTTDGEFDIEGYLECVSAEAGAIPDAGNNSLQLAGVAGALVLVGGAAVVSARRRRPA